MSSNEYTNNLDGQFDLADDDGLPWLDEDEDEGGLDKGRIVIFVLILLLLMAAILGALYYFTKDSGSSAIVADGSTIEAPEGPYKERPDNPGGKEYAGTGDVAPGVGEGQSTAAVVAQVEPKPAPAPAPASKAAAEPSIDTLTTLDEPAPAKQPVVQVGAYGSRTLAEAGWAQLSRQSSLLSGKSYRIQRGQADIGTVYRVQLVQGSMDEARAFCRQLRAEGIACAAKRD